MTSIAERRDTERLADLRALKAVAGRRQSLRPNSPEWRAASKVEAIAIERLRRWSPSMPSRTRGAP